MEHKRIAIAGFGDIGSRVCARLGAPWRALALRRRAREVPAGVRGIAADLRRADTLSCLERLAPDALLITLSPGARDVDAYRAGFAGAMANVIAGLGAHRPKWAFFLSSTRVYAEQDGDWIDEDSPLADKDPHAAAILEAEDRFREAFCGGLVLRAGGLYGNGPGPLLRAVGAGRLRPESPLVYGNRFHRDDAAGFILHALESEPGAATINLVDDACVPLQEVEQWLCERLRQAYTPPQEDTASPAPRHKRIRNDRLHATAYTLLHADYRSGYGEVLRQWTAHSEREDGLDLH